METRRGSVLIILIIVVVIIIALVAWWIIWQQGMAEQAPTTTATTTPSSTINYLSDDQTPTGIPSGLPIDASPEILQNSQSNYPVSRPQQALFEYVTAKTVEQAYADYMNYLRQNNWIVTASSTASGVGRISAQTKFVAMSVIIGTNTVLNQNTVTIATNYYAPSTAPLSETSTATGRP